MSERFICRDCGRSFIVSYDQQRWYRENHKAPPRRCPDCRSAGRSSYDGGMRSEVGPPPDWQPPRQQPPWQPAPPAWGSQRSAPPPPPRSEGLLGALRRFIRALFTGK